MDAPKFDVLMQAIDLYLKAGGGRVRLRMDPKGQALFTTDVRQELLTPLGLLGAMSPGHEDRAEHVVALGDGEYAKGALALVPPEVAGDPAELRAMLDRLDARHRRHHGDRQEVEDIARASGMVTGEPDPPEREEGAFPGSDGARRGSGGIRWAHAGPSAKGAGPDAYQKRGGWCQAARSRIGGTRSGREPGPPTWENGCIRQSSP